MPKVGIFFVVNGEYLIDAVPLNQANVYGRYLEYGGHYDYWLNLQPTTTIEYLFKTRAYDAVARGRVVFLLSHKRFVLYADYCIKRPQILTISEAFLIPKAQILLRRDEHYQCANCCSNYLD